MVSFSGNVATALAVGKVRITATQAGNSNWLVATAYQDWIVTATPRSDQNITFAAIPDKNALSANFALDANASSGLPVSFTSMTPNIATVDGNGTVSILEHGRGNLQGITGWKSKLQPSINCGSDLDHH